MQVNKITIIKGLGLFIVGIYCLSFAHKKINAQEITEIAIDIKQNERNPLLEPEDIHQILIEKYSEPVIGQKVTDFDFIGLDSVLTQSAFVKSANAFSNVQGKLFLRIESEQPILRIINSSGAQYYLTKEGRKMPLSSHQSARVIIANGRITEEFSNTDSLSTTVLKNLYKVAQQLEEQPFFKALTGQLSVASNGDIILITKAEERHDINLGNAEDLPSKFDRLRQFYTKVLSIKGWGAYTTLNLKYKNQIIAKK